MSFSQVIQGEKTIIHKASQAFYAYESIISKLEKTAIDEKLIKFLDSRIKVLFDEGLGLNVDNLSP